MTKDIDDDRPRLVVFSGAGLSADSGISTFRDKDGLWEKHDVRKVADGNTWRANWDLVRRFYNDRRRALATVEPNAMHHQIAAWQRQYDTVILTQNIDDLLERAGCQDVVHLHGDLTGMKCVACGSTWDVGHTEVGPDDRCISERCNSLRGVRPDVVFFHEMAPRYAIMNRTFKGLRPQDCVVVIGTSGMVINIDQIMFMKGCHKILNNLEPSEWIDATNFDHVLYGRAADMASEINALVFKHMVQHDPSMRLSNDTMRRLRNADETG